MDTFYFGKSMRGTFQVGDRLIVVPMAPAEVQAGDIVVFRPPSCARDSTLIVHRVMRVGPCGLVTQGDNRPEPDAALLTGERLLGRVTHADRHGTTFPVTGGHWGLVRARLLHTPHSVWRVMSLVGGPLYRQLRASGLVARFWRPPVSVIRVESAQGPVVKYVCRGRTVARRWVATGYFECRKPYDLIIPRPQ